MDDFNNNERMGTRPSGYVPPQNTGCVNPADIYARANHTNGGMNNGAPQYHYGAPMQPVVNNQYVFEQQQRLAQRREHEKNIRKTSNGVGIAVILYYSLASAFSMLFIIPAIAEKYVSSVAFENAVGVLYSFFTMGLVFLFAAKMFKKNGIELNISFDKPQGGKNVPLIILAGIGGCLVANYITSVVRIMFEGIGLYVDYTAVEDPKNITDIILMFICTTVVAPLLEEFAMRGVVLQSLRKYGNGFAIIASSFIFALLHGNPVQILFAFMCGILLGYAAVATGSLWTSIIIHAAVNSLSCIASAMYYFTSEAVTDRAYVIITAVLTSVGVICALGYLLGRKYEPVFAYKGYGDLTTGAKFKNFLKSPAIIVAVIFFVWEAINAITTTPTTY